MLAIRFILFFKNVLNVFKPKVGFTPKFSKDIFIPFDPLLIWGLK
jgi:hypothetical protein